MTLSKNEKYGKLISDLISNLCEKLKSVYFLVRLKVDPFKD